MAAAPPTFVLRYGGRAEVALRDALEALGWVEAEEGAAAPPTLFFLPYSRVPWDAALSGSALCACHPVRTALVRKDALLALTARLAPGAAPPGVLIARATSPAAVRAQLAALGGPFIVKSPALNNALGVRLCGSVEAAAAAAAELLAALPPAAGACVLAQALIARPAHPLLLHQGAFKFHARVNVLALGACAVYVHDDVVCHVACEPAASADAGGGGGGAGADPAAFAHVTNHVLQRRHARYARAAHTLLLRDLAAAPQPAEHAFTADEAMRAIRALLRAVFRAALAGRRLAFPPLPEGSSGEDAAAAAAAPPGSSAAPPAPLAFLPAANCFEVFGADVLLLRGARGGGAVRAALLEVNGGPALEGLALPAVCARVCADIVELALGHVGAGAPLVWPAPPAPRAGSKWARVL